MSDFTSFDFKVGMFLRYNKTKVEILKINHPYALLQFPCNNSAGIKPTYAVNLLKFTKDDIIVPEELCSKEYSEDEDWTEPLEDLLDD